VSRIAALALAALLAGAVVVLPASAAPRKHATKHAKKATDRCGKRARCARVRRAVPRRAPAERLVDASPRRAFVPEQPDSPAPTDPVLPDFVSVSAREFSLTLSRPLVGAGGVRIELRNVGEDPHNLVVSPDGTHTPLDSFATLDPGAYERRAVTLTPGRYRLWCSLEGHEALGMSVTLRVG
jgi:hypothetical protein